MTVNKTFLGRYLDFKRNYLRLVKNIVGKNLKVLINLKCISNQDRIFSFISIFKF